MKVVAAAEAVRREFSEHPAGRDTGSYPARPVEPGPFCRELMPNGRRPPDPRGSQSAQHLIDAHHHDYRPPDFSGPRVAADRTSYSCRILASSASSSRMRRLRRRMSDRMCGSGPRTYPSSAFATAGPYPTPARASGRSPGCSSRSGRLPEAEPAKGAGVDGRNGHGILRVVLSASVHAAAMFAR